MGAYHRRRPRQNGDVSLRFNESKNHLEGQVSPHFAETESLLKRRELYAAADAFSQLRPAFKSSLEGLMLSARIHAAAKRWSNVDVLCRIIRTEHPAEAFGFVAAAESLRQQG